MRKVGLVLCAAVVLAGVPTATAATLYVSEQSPNPTLPYATWATAATGIQQAVDAAMAGDEIVVTNGVYRTGTRPVYGMSNRVAVVRPLTVRSVNGPAVTHIVGYQVPGTTNGAAAVRCVYLTNGAVLAGFTLTNGATQTVGDNQSGGGVWCEGTNTAISNCVLIRNSARGNGGGARLGTLTACTLTGNSARGGGGGAERCTLNNCILMGNLADVGGGAVNSTLNNCTLDNNSAASYGGGTFGGTLTNCKLNGNRASFNGGGAGCGTLNGCMLTRNSANYGGGADFCLVNNSILVGKMAQTGGGADDCFMKNCTLTGNSATFAGGGAAFCPLLNCIIYYNAAPSGANYYREEVSHCCTTPLAEGAGNFTDPPLFLDANGWRNLRLQSNSPCINSGDNAYAPDPADLDGRPRIVDGRVDIGAYEFQGPGLGEFTSWLQQYGLPTDGSADAADSDFDGLNNEQEWQADTDPTNAVSVLRISFVSDGPPVTVWFYSSSQRLYTLRYATQLPAVTWIDVPGQIGVPGTGGLQGLSDTTAASQRFYRVSARTP